MTEFLLNYHTEPGSWVPLNSPNLQKHLGGDCWLSSLLLTDMLRRSQNNSFPQAALSCAVIKKQKTKNKKHLILILSPGILVKPTHPMLKRNRKLTNIIFFFFYFCSVCLSSGPKLGSFLRGYDAQELGSRVKQACMHIFPFYTSESPKMLLWILWK